MKSRKSESLKSKSRKSNKKCKSCKGCKISSLGKCMCNKKSCMCCKLRIKRMFGIPASATFLRK